MLDDFKTASEKEKYFSSAEKEYDMLKKKVAHDKVADLQKFKDEIKEVLENEIVSRYYFQNGQIEVSFNDDVEIKKAIEALNNKAVYDSILTHSMASMREKH